MREVFLVRHGKAVASAPGGDAARPLTDEGRAGINDVARALKSFGVSPAVVWHSPYTRAAETAEILAAVLGGRCSADGAFTPSSSAERAVQQIQQSEARCLVVVSHMPLLPDVCTELVGARVDFGTGTVAHVGSLGPHGTVLLGLWTSEKLALVVNGR